MDYKRYKHRSLQHLVERALRRNTFTATQPIRVIVREGAIWLYGSVSHADMIPEAVAVAEAVAPSVRVYSRLRVRSVRV